MRASGVDPVEKAAAGGQDADTIRELVAHSRAAGVLDVQFSEPIKRAIALGTLTVGDIVHTDRAPTSVPVTATAADIQAVAASSGHLRILVGTGADCRVAHVRDTLTVTAHTLAVDIAREALTVTPVALAFDTLARMRRERVQLATVVDADRLLGVITLDDLLREILPGATDPHGTTTPDDPRY